MSERRREEDDYNQDHKSNLSTVNISILTRRSCMFCGTTHELTKEHVIPLWLQRHVGGNTKGTFRGTHLNFVGMPLSERTASGQSHALGAVCASCNNGWMSRLESDFQALLPRLQVEMAPRRFSKAERYKIAMWIVKTGVVAHRSANFRSILPDSVPHSLMQGASIPAGIKVFGGKINGGTTIRWAQSNLRFAQIRKDYFQDFDANKTFIFLLSIADIFIGFGWHALNPREFEIYPVGDSTHQIYPHPDAAKRPHVFEDLIEAATKIGVRSKRA